MTTKLDDELYARVLYQVGREYAEKYDDCFRIRDYADKHAAAYLRAIERRAQWITKQIMALRKQGYDVFDYEHYVQMEPTPKYLFDWSKAPVVRRPPVRKDLADDLMGL